MVDEKKFEYEFKDESPRGITFEYDESMGDESLEVIKTEDQVGIHLNKAGCLVLAKALIKMAYCDYEEGFHFHLNEDFDGEKPQVLWVGV